MRSCLDLITQYDIRIFRCARVFRWRGAFHWRWGLPLREAFSTGVEAFPLRGAFHWLEGFRGAGPFPLRGGYRCAFRLAVGFPPGGGAFLLGGLFRLAVGLFAVGGMMTERIIGGWFE